MYFFFKGQTYKWLWFATFTEYSRAYEAVWGYVFREEIFPFHSDLLVQVWSWGRTLKRLLALAAVQGFEPHLTRWRLTDLLCIQLVDGSPPLPLLEICCLDGMLEQDCLQYFISVSFHSFLNEFPCSVLPQFKFREIEVSESFCLFQLSLLFWFYEWEFFFISIFVFSLGFFLLQIMLSTFSAPFRVVFSSFCLWQIVT